MEVSENAAKGTDQSGNTFWNSCFASYEKLRVHTNNINVEVPGWKQLPERTMVSLRTQWKRCIQPAVQKFAGICLTNPPASGVQKDDPEMDLYYKKMREIYYARSVKWNRLPRSIVRSLSIILSHFPLLLYGQSIIATRTRSFDSSNPVLFDNLFYHHTQNIGRHSSIIITFSGSCRSKNEN